MIWHPITERRVVREFCRRDPHRYLFHLADLDPVEWRSSDYYGLGDPDDPAEVIFLYRGLSLPSAHLLGRNQPLGDNLTAALPLLPDHIYVHCLQGDLPRLRESFRVDVEGEFSRMILDHPPAAPPETGVRATPLGAGDLDPLLDLLSSAYPGTIFEPTHLAKGVTFGIREGGRLVACAGVHVHSAAEGMAMLGNIATLPERRNRGLGRAVTRALVAHLAQRIPLIGLNVQADNLAAIAMYERVGFRERFRCLESECRRLKSSGEEER